MTSRETHQWIIPKGWLQSRREDHAQAAREAIEEAGVMGIADPVSIGAYTYQKRRPNGVTTVRVTVYLLEVEEELADWWEAEAARACMVHARRSRRQGRGAGAEGAATSGALVTLM